MDIRQIFKEISEQLLSEFRKAAQVAHSGGKGDLREDAFRKFLSDYLPARYAVGKGEVITPENKVSPELDIVIYDPNHCPALVKSTSHSVYPIESVYGAISIKSHLDSGELANAYQNIRSFKAILPRGGFVYRPSPGHSVGLATPMPVTGIVAYSANRSLDAIAAQVKALDADSADTQLRPDFVAVIGQGIIAPRTPLRHEFNNFRLPSNLEHLVELRKTGRHTLFRLYMQVLREINQIILRPLDLHVYDEMPRLIGPYRVRQPDRFVEVKTDNPEQRRVLRLNEAAIMHIVNNSQPVTYRQHLLNTVGQIPLGIDQLGQDLDATIYEYNPNKRPPLSCNSILFDAEGNPHIQEPFFQPTSMQIDEKLYAVDITALTQDHFDDDPDFTADELMSI